MASRKGWTIAKVVGKLQASRHVDIVLWFAGFRLGGPDDPKAIQVRSGPGWRRVPTVMSRGPDLRARMTANTSPPTRQEYFPNGQTCYCQGAFR